MYIQLNILSTEDLLLATVAEPVIVYDVVRSVQAAHLFYDLG